VLPEPLDIKFLELDDDDDPTFGGEEVDESSSNNAEQLEWDLSSLMLYLDEVVVLVVVLVCLGADDQLLDGWCNAFCEIFFASWKPQMPIDVFVLVGESSKRLHTGTNGSKNLEQRRKCTRSGKYGTG
jgi:hypothetical protein